MVFALGLGLVGVLLIYLEFFVPGGILCAVGIVLILIGGGVLIWFGKSLYIVLSYAFGGIFLLMITIRIALQKIKKRPALYASDDQSGYVASQYDETVLNKRGHALTDLKPSGYIMVDGQQYQAVSESTYIKKGESIKVTSGEGARYKVRSDNG